MDVPDETARRRDPRLLDAEREQVLGWLHAAPTEGRLDLAGFDERTSCVLRARTLREVEPCRSMTP